MLGEKEEHGAVQHIPTIDTGKTCMHDRHLARKESGATVPCSEFTRQLQKATSKQVRSDKDKERCCRRRVFGASISNGKSTCRVFQVRFAAIVAKVSVGLDMVYSTRQFRISMLYLSFARCFWSILPSFPNFPSLINLVTSSATHGHRTIASRRWSIYHSPHEQLGPQSSRTSGTIIYPSRTLMLPVIRFNILVEIDEHALPIWWKSQIHS
ncbi:hypothetical protein BDU57DRAFT_306069 [Ampelomyces quisqualis]|uniref:Uncharacterized protein n=1 Tax=Ampelomyces quisqualis TaxID=50730 RepID=A0A6A5QH69_AMPQU|nr:hypothetical protein BDU57DRAFT_306069 [Ampelomyces quisqualis]